MTRFRDRAFNAWVTQRPCDGESTFVGWLHGEMRRHDVERSRRTCYNWLHDTVEIPVEAWHALRQIEADAIRNLNAQIRGLK